MRVDPNYVTNLAAALDRFADLSLATRNHMSEAAWRSGQAFSWSARIAYAISLYKELLSYPQSPLD